MASSDLAANNQNSKTMKNNYKLSFITAIYGVEPYIEKFTESFLGQTSVEPGDVQFIFVNDGTKDRSMEIVDRVIEEHFSHLKEHIVIINKENAGLPQARKSGLDAATGEYILFADSDDWLEPNVVAKVLAKAKETNADIVYFDFIKEYGHKQSENHERNYTADMRDQWIINMFNYRAHGFVWTKCFRRSLYTQGTVYFPTLGMHEDKYLMVQIIPRAKVIVQLPEVLYHYRKDNSSAMCSQPRAMRHIESSRNMLHLYEKFMDNIAESPIRDVADSMILRAGWHHIIHKHDMYAEYPWLGQAIRKARVKNGYRTPLLFQIIVKCYNKIFH